MKVKLQDLNNLIDLYFLKQIIEIVCQTVQRVVHRRQVTGPTLKISILSPKLF